MRHRTPPNAELPPGVAGPAPGPMAKYEDQLNRDPRWALSEGSRHFEEDSFKALHGIASRL